MRKAIGRHLMRRRPMAFLRTRSAPLVTLVEAGDLPARVGGSADHTS